MAKLLVTGASGRVAGLVCPDLARDHELQLTDLHPKKGMTQLDLENRAAVLEACRGMEMVLHLATVNYQFPWEKQINANLLGMQHVFEAAKKAGCKRVVVFSSVQAVWGHPHRPICETDAPYPTNFYGVCKAYTEALARMHSHDGSLSVICVRLGAVLTHNDHRLGSKDPNLQFSITPTDLCQLVRCCLQTSAHFALVHGVSGQQPAFLSLTETTRQIGYLPQDDPSTMRLTLTQRLAGLFRRTQQKLARMLK
jgi:UDP-glucose 4-epimerase